MARSGFEPASVFTGSGDVARKGGSPRGSNSEIQVRETDTQEDRRQQALDDLQRAWKSLRRMEDLADDPTEAKVAGRAVAILDTAFAELEVGR